MIKSIGKSRLKKIHVDYFFKQMEVFQWGFLQDVESFIRLLNKKKIPIEHAVECIHIRQGKLDADWKQEEQDRSNYVKKAKKCPECGQMLALEPVLQPEGPSNKKGYKSVWYCTAGWEQEDPEKFCGFHSYSIKSVNQYLKKMKIKARMADKPRPCDKKRGK